MGIQIKWNDRNLAEEGHVVYRSLSPMDPAALPAPFASVGPDVTRYEDGTVTAGTRYYYRVAAFAGGLEAVSDEISVVAEENGATSVIFTFSDSVEPGPVNRADPEAGFTDYAQDPYGDGTRITFSLVSDTSNQSMSFDNNVSYALDWPLDPVVDSSGDYTSRFNSGEMVWRIDGLTPDSMYRIEFVGSRHTSGTRNLIIEMDGTSREIDTGYNSDRVIVFETMSTPDGQLFFTHKSDGTDYSYFSAFYLRGPL